jgi:adenosylcobinamide-GDP ribazoletransferase
VPINKSLPCENEDYKNSAIFFWLIGLLIGLCQYLLFIVLEKIIPINFVVISIIRFEILITGALHMDGFGDTCDGFFAFKGKDRIIEIMKDRRISAFGCIGIELSI